MTNFIENGGPASRELSKFLHYSEPVNIQQVSSFLILWSPRYFDSNKLHSANWTVVDIENMELLESARAEYGQGMVSLYFLFCWTTKKA